ncbi:hypothetical protein D3C80_1338540 [compost metagenome]
MHAVDLAQVVGALAERVGQPLGIFVGVLVPDLAAQGAELGGAFHAPQKTDHLADRRLEGQFARGDGREAFLQVVTQHRPGETDGPYTRAVFLQGAVLDHMRDQF